MTKKNLDTTELKNQLKGSVFFTKDDQPAGENPEDVSETSPQEAVSSPVVSTSPSQAESLSEPMDELLQEVPLRKWRDVIENTETQNSALRLTSDERYAVEDLVQELERKYKIKTSMNEIARLGLLLIVQDFKKNKTKSVIFAIKKL